MVGRIIGGVQVGWLNKPVVKNLPQQAVFEDAAEGAEAVFPADFLHSGSRCDRVRKWQPHRWAETPLLSDPVSCPYAHSPQ